MTTFLRAVWKRISPYRSSLLIIVVFVAGFMLGNQRFVGQAQGDTTPPAGDEQNFEPFWQVYNLIRNEYLNRGETTPDSLVNGAIKGMMDTLGDQFSAYMDPETYPLMNSDLSGEVEGIGAVVETLEDTQEIRIVNVLEGSPAEAAGLQSGDIFIKVDGEDITGMSQLEVVTKVRGPEGSTVTLTMRRGEEELEFTVVRERITIPTVEWKMLDNNIGYIKLRDFSVNAREQLDSALQDLDVNNLDGLVLDVRGNPGGLLSTAIDIASAFIKDGTVLVEDFGGGNAQTFSANGNYIGISIPMVLLVDQNSASASELLAGALQDNHRATIVGVTTFGKGTVQTWQPLVNGGGVRLTIARWLTPDGNWIHEQGITPDVIVEWPQEDRDPDNDPQLNAAIEQLLQPTTQAAGQ